MEILIRSRNLEVTDSLRAYIEKKVAKLDRYMPNIGEAQIDLTVQNARNAQDRQVAQITLRNSNGTILRAEERSSDMRSSIDQAIAKIERQIKRYKGKYWQSKERAQVETAEETEVEIDLESQIVRTKRFEMRPMEVDEAIEQMELLGHDFFVFYNATSSSVNVVYRRRDGGYGLLIPELA